MISAVAPPQHPRLKPYGCLDHCTNGLISALFRLWFLQYVFLCFWSHYHSKNYDLGLKTCILYERV